MIEILINILMFIAGAAAAVLGISCAARVKSKTRNDGLNYPEGKDGFKYDRRGSKKTS